MSIERVTEVDLAWWLETASKQEWIWAKTYAKTAPHSYIVQGRTPSLTRRDYVRAGAVIRAFGEPGKFYGSTNIYLTSTDGLTKWWTMDPNVVDTTLVNTAPTDQVYGEQNAPRTFSGIRSVYDEIALQYDEFAFFVSDEEKIALLRLIDGHVGDHPTTLDVGCGTGATLDLGIAGRDRYTGVDPSQAMLNELVIKQSGKIARVIPTRMEDAFAQLIGEKFELVSALFGSASYLHPDAICRLPELCSGTLLLMTYADGFVPAFHDRPLLTAPEASEALRELAVENDAPITRIGKFDALLVES